MVYKKPLPKKNLFTNKNIEVVRIPSISLPTEKTTISKNLSDYCLMIYGEGKIGKTSLCAQFPDTLILAFEPGTSSIECYVLTMTKWQDFTDTIELLKKGNHNYKNIIIDNVQIAYNYCSKFICDKIGIDGAGEAKDYGVTWSNISREFTSQINEIINYGIKPIFTAHSRIRDIESLSGNKYQRIEPLISGQLSEILKSSVDLLGYFNYYKTNRYLTIRGNDYVDAGTRMTKFWIAKTSKPIINISMGNNPEEAYNNLINAFQNKQATSFEKLI
jgi:phage nucleotide-binding protein